MTDQPRALPSTPVVLAVRGTKAMQVNLVWVTGDTELRLMAEPDNPVDPNAVQVEGLSEVAGQWLLLGYVPREIAARLAPEVQQWEVVVYEVLTYEGVNSGLRVTIYPQGHDPERLPRPYRPRPRRRHVEPEDWGYGY